MRSIGIRVASNEIFYAVFEGNITKPSLLFHNKLSVPKSYKDGEALSWLRENIINVFLEYQVKAVFIRTMEMNSKTNKKAIMERSRIEGVLLEAGNSSGSVVGLGSNATLTSLLAVQSMKSAKGYMELDDFREVEQWSSLNEKYKDACLAGTAALSLLADNEL